MPRRATWTDGWWHRAQRCASPNHGPRPDGAAATLVVIHSISLPPGHYGGHGVQRLFTNTLDADEHPYYAQLAGLKVSAHFFIRRDGRWVQFVSCDQRAWHAGVSQWQGRTMCNDWSIGVELEGLEGEPFTAVQHRQLAHLLRAVCRRYPIEWVAGHEHVAPGRKADPGSRFDWRGLSRALPPSVDAARHISSFA